MWYNTVMAWLLRSPLHGLISGSVVLVTVTGRKSGKTYTLPVNYVREGDVLHTTSYRSRTWWRNLRGGQPAALVLQGREVSAVGEVAETQEDVETALATLLRLAPQSRRFLKVSVDPATGAPNPAELARAAQDRVVVRWRLEQ